MRDQNILPCLHLSVLATFPHSLGRSHAHSPLLAQAAKHRHLLGSHFGADSGAYSTFRVQILAASTSRGGGELPNITKMSCNGCRVLRKGCSDTCILRSCLQWIESPEAQGHATLFVAKFFGRAGMLSFINAVAESQRPALFQSLLYEACGRTVNPVFGAVGLLWSGNWAVCQAAVETVLKGGSLKPLACPPSTKPLHEPHVKLSLKRPHSKAAEATMNANVEAKRFRSSDWHEDCPELCRNTANVPHAEQSLPNIEVNSFSNPGFWGNSDTVSKQARRSSSPCGQLVAPVARRVKPKGGYGLPSMAAREHLQQDASEQQERQGHKFVELDLSLNSHGCVNENAGATAQRRDEGEAKANSHHDVESHVVFESSLCNDDENSASLVGAVRTSSSGSHSTNSECSSTSADTAEFSIAGVKAFAAVVRTSRHEDDQLHEDYQLLHLL